MKIKKFINFKSRKIRQVQRSVISETNKMSDTITESLFSDPTDELINQLDDSFVEEYYDDNANHDVEEIIKFWPNIVWQHIDDESFVEDWIDDEVGNKSLEDIDKEDLINYIQRHYSETKENKILELYIENNGLEGNSIISNISGKISFEKTKTGKNKVIVTSNDGKFKKYTVPVNYNIVVRENDIVNVNDKLAKLEFDDFMLDDLPDDDLRSVIEEDNDGENCVREIVENRHKNQSVQELIEDEYGELNAKDLYNAIQNYIDDDAIIQIYKENEDYEDKVYYLKNAISSDRNLQKKILDLDPKNSILLANSFVEDGYSRSFIGDEYDFQKAYIESKIKEFLDEEEIADEDEIGHVKAEALKFLHNEFGLDSDIENEYENDLWLAHSTKYNI